MVLFGGASGRGGIDGVFWNSNSEVLLQFCKEVCVDLVIHTEMLLFRKGY